MQRISAIDVQRQQGALLGGWTPPAGCVLWLAAANSGAVAPGGTWLDASGAGNHATLAGAAYVSASGGLVRGVYTDYASFAGPALSLPITLCAWVRQTVAGVISQVSLVATGDWGYPGGVSNYYGAQLTLTLYGGAAAQFGDGGGPGGGSRRTALFGYLALASWVHCVAVVRGATDMDFFANTTPLGASYSGTGDGIANNGQWSVGRENTTADARVSIDDVQVFSRALSPAEIADIYAHSPGSHAP